MKLKGLHFVDVAGIQETVTNELQKVQKEEFSVAFQKLYNHTKACIYVNGAHFEYKKRYVSLIFKKISLKTSGLHCVGLFFVLPSHTTKTHPIEGPRKLT